MPVDGASGIASVPKKDTQSQSIGVIFYLVSFVAASSGLGPCVYLNNRQSIVV